MTEDFQSQFRDGVKYFIWMCVLTLIVGIAVYVILMPHPVAPTAQAQPTVSVASVAGTAGLDTVS
jgi:hypothetical protein